MASKIATQTATLIIAQVNKRLDTLKRNVSPDGDPKFTKAYREFMEYELYQCIITLNDVIKTLDS